MTQSSVNSNQDDKMSQNDMDEDDLFDENEDTLTLFLRFIDFFVMPRRVNFCK